MISSITIQTTKRTEVIDVTGQLSAFLGGVRSGIALFNVPHTTAALIICEDDAELREDIIKVAETWLHDLRPFKHIRKNNPNTEAHIMSAAFGTSVILAVEAGRLQLGTYQNVLLLELDGPKARVIQAKVIAG